MNEKSREELLEHWSLIERRQRAVLDSLATRLPVESIREVENLLDHNELGIALETLASALAAERIEVGDSMRDEINTIATSLDLNLDLPRLP